MLLKHARKDQDESDKSMQGMGRDTLERLDNGMHDREDVLHEPRDLELGGDKRTTPRESDNKPTDDIERRDEGIR